MALRWIFRGSVHLVRLCDSGPPIRSHDRRNWSSKHLNVESFALEAGTGKVEIQPRVSAASPRRQVTDG